AVGFPSRLRAARLSGLFSSVLCPRGEPFRRSGVCVGTVRRKCLIRPVHQAGRAKNVAKRKFKLVTPTTVFRTVMPTRPPNSELRTREYLTQAEVERLTKAAGKNRHGHRDATMILVAFRHGLRAAELVDLRWDQVDFRTGNMHVRRVKSGVSATDPI